VRVAVELVRRSGEGDHQRALADIHQAGQAHEALEQFDVVLGAGCAQALVAGQRAHFLELAAEAQAHGRRQQARGDPACGEIEQLLAGRVETLDLGDRAGLALVAVEDRLDVQRGAERGAEEAHALVAALLDAVAQVVQVRRHHVGVRVRVQVLDPRADLRRRLAGGAQARGLDHRDARAGEHVLAVDHAQRERSVVAGSGAHRLVAVEDGVAGLHRVVVDAAAGAGGGDAEHVVVVEHQLAEEQVVHLLHGERRGLGLERARRGLAREEVQGRLLVAHVGEHRLADLHGDRQDGDVLAFDEIRGQVDGRVRDDSDAHGFPLARRRRDATALSQAPHAALRKPERPRRCSRPRR
jgi:hypothetical protein